MARVLIACEFSGRVRDAFIARGHDAVSCDILPTERPGPHYRGDVLDILHDGWDMMIAHPPCTYLANSGAKHLYQGMNRLNHPNEARWAELREGAEFFRTLWTADIPYVAVENPVMLKAAQDIIGAGPSQIIQPWQFGHNEAKGTALWLRGLPLLVPTEVVDGRAQRVHMAPESKNRQKNRSRTFYGVAKAMANQWGPLLESTSG